ncbi:hypothetical protein PIB30_005268 [Stylosanthes scabra]|uniref:Uncharacterized protein n=1 Tax=Stylosanthes scabra TaxID=79078 RepID=A0ABU6T3U2_9FABA|nr:hypothetical protein [Stylosanthes scabra]
MTWRLLSDVDSNLVMCEWFLAEGTHRPLYPLSKGCDGANWGQSSWNSFPITGIHNRAVRKDLNLEREMDAIQKHDPKQYLVHEIERRVWNRRRMLIPITMSVPKSIEIPTTAASAEASAAASSENTIVAVTKEKTLVSGTVARQLALRSLFIPKKRPTRFTGGGATAS